MPFPVLAPGSLVRIRDERWVVTRQTAAGSATAVLDVCGRDRTNLKARASFLLPFEIVEPLPSTESPRRVRRRTWRRLAGAMLTSATPCWTALRTPLHARISLLPFQLEPALAVTRGAASRILIADEVGLGKTIQAGLVMAEILARTRNGRVLVVAPASLREQWQAELRERFGVSAWIADSTSLARLAAAWSDANPWAAHEVTITSIDFVKRPESIRALEALVWDAVVFDEAHALAGHSDRAVAASALACRARIVVLLTGTPHTGDDRAFDALCRTGDLHQSFPLLVFRRRRGDVGLSHSRRTTSLRVRPTLAEREMHRVLDGYARKVRRERAATADAAHLAMTVLTRRACSSAASLARSVERRLVLLEHAGDSGTQQMTLPLFDVSADEEPGAELSAPGLDDRREERRRLEHILALARRAQPAESKLRTLARLLRRTGEPAIVFTEYRDTLAWLAEALRIHDPVVLHGGLAAADRRESLRRFTIGMARLLLATDAASEGLNLQHRCRLVVNLEVPWTPLRLEQRIGRVERIGQSRRVHVVHLLSAGTADESYAVKLIARADRAAAALGPLADGSPIAAHPSGLITSNLRATAEAEAARLHTARRLARAGEDPPLDSRPPVTAVRGRGSRCLLWGFHLEFTDAHLQVVWRTLIGARTPWRYESPGERRFTEAAAIGARLDEAGRDTLEQLAAVLGAHVTLASRRERAIAEALAAERARLSLKLLQPGLFDRRTERAVAAQSAVVEEALARCATRLDELAATEHLSAEQPRLAFALIRR